MKIKKIVIVGGGSAGWMSAATMISQFPDIETTVIESPDVPTVGVGESTIGGINNWVNLVGIDRNDFIPHTDASYKLSIRFTDFYKKESGSFHYPFGSPMDNTNDWVIKNIKDKNYNDYAETMYPQMSLVTQNKIDKNVNNRLPNFNFDRDTAFHFDATAFATWLRDKFSKPKGVKHIQALVKHVTTNEDGIQHLVLDNDEIITADLFIDCTGFKSMLLADALNEPFTSYSDILPNNSAWATQVQYTNKEEQLVSYTDCWAIENGWVWNIPLWSRIGTGYVYSDNYVSDEDALEQFKKHLKTRGTYRDDLKFRNIKMRVGVHERIWVKNVAAIGLSAGFIEPLESSGLYTVHEFLMKLVRTIGRSEDRSVSQWDKDNYSYQCIRKFKAFAHFVAMHYAATKRDDTPYWKDCSKRVYSQHMSLPNSQPDMDLFQFQSHQRFLDNWYNPQFSGLDCVMNGLHCTATDEYILKSEDFYGNSNNYDMIIQNLENRKQDWNDSVKGCLSLMEYLSLYHHSTW